MPDPLDRAVDAQIDAYRPEAVPPFTVIEGRKRRRDRHRLAAGAALLGVAAVATAAIAGSGVRPQDSERLAPVAAPTSEPRSAAPAWDGRNGPLAEDGAAASCVETYSPTTLLNRAFAFDGTVTAIGGSVSNRPDKGQMNLVGVTFAVNRWYTGGDQDSVTVDLGAPAPADGAEPAYEVGSRLLVSGEPRWGGEPLDQPIAWGMCGGFTRYYDPETAQVWQDAFAAQNSPDNLRLVYDVQGATLCLADAGGAYSDSGCRPISEEGAERLVRALNGAQPQGRQPLCDASGPTYQLTFDVPGAKVVPIVIPTACGPIAVGDAKYRISDRVVRVLGAEYNLDAKLAGAEARRLVRLVRNFAQNPSTATAQQVPFASTVRLGLGQKILKQATASELQKPETWDVPTAGGYDWIADPTVNALDLLSDNEPHTAVVGPHPHCASPARPGPAELADYQQVSTQPSDPASCNGWYTVDIFVRDGKIEAVTLDLWEP